MLAEAASVLSLTGGGSVPKLTYKGCWQVLGSHGLLTRYISSFHKGSTEKLAAGFLQSEWASEQEVKKGREGIQVGVL